MKSLQFVYRKAEMRTVSSTSYGQGGVSIANTGFDGFGPLLVKQAEAAFAQQKVTVVGAKVIEDKEPIKVESSSQAADDGTARTFAAPVLIVTPTSGKVSANQHATRTSYVFSVLLIDPDARRTIWRATIDTSTWSGQDFVLKNVSKTLYDESYASQLLSAIANQMKIDGVI
ncbi:MAG: hypothetical protein Q8K91_08475 [Hylemonella sp.]|nr:hypothetical protein [Hylemonella sp.]MDP1937226.1 hypothetical protein [Hylemonella sp.]